jgi:hypothetical protein
MEIVCEALSEYETREVYEDRSRNVYHVDRITFFTDEVVASAVWASTEPPRPSSGCSTQIAQMQLPNVDRGDLTIYPPWYHV